MAFAGFGAPATPAFGASTTPSLFGASSSTPAFGSTAAPAFGASTAPSFGSTAAPSFGAPSSTPAFGSTAAPAFGSTAAPSFGSTAAPSFGSTAAPSFGSTAPSFGASAPAFGSTAAPSLFGATAPSLTTPSFGTTTFGAPATTSPFGATSTTATSTLFGSTPAFGTSTFPSTSTAPSLFGAQPQPQPQAQTQPAQHTPLQKLDALFNCFNPQSPQCKFRHMFYNQINASADDIKRMNAMKPAHIDQLLWDQAIRNNPDTSKFVPVQACGFEDLKSRIAEQDKLTNQQTQTLQDASKAIDAIKRKHANETLAKLDDYKRRQLEIAQRLIRIISKIIVLEAQGTRLTVGEEQLKRKFEMILQDLTSPTLYRAKIEDFISLSKITVPSSALPQVDERTLENIAKTLKEQRAGLEVLTNMVQKDSKDVQFMLSELS